MTTSFINKTVNSMLFAYGLVNRDINNFELKIQKCTQEACRSWEINVNRRTFICLIDQWLRRGTNRCVYDDPARWDPRVL